MHFLDLFGGGFDVFFLSCSWGGKGRRRLRRWPGGPVLIKVEGGGFRGGGARGGRAPGNVCGEGGGGLNSFLGAEMPTK